MGLNLFFCPKYLLESNLPGLPVTFKQHLFDQATFLYKITSVRAEVLPVLSNEGEGVGGVGAHEESRTVLASLWLLMLKASAASE